MNRTLSASALALAAVSLVAAGDASADTRSWTAVKKVVGKGDTAVVSVDLAQLRSSVAFKAGVELFLAQEEEAAKVLETVKSTCGFDVMNVLSDMTFVFQGDGDDPLIAFGLDGIDEPKVVSCLGTVAGQMTGTPGVKISGKKIGKVTEYSVKGEKKKLYAAWLAKDVLAFTDDANDKKKLDRRLTGKGISPKLKSLLASSAGASPFWFAAAVTERENGRTITGAHGRVELAAGTFRGAGAMVMASAAEATGMAADGTEALAGAKAEATTQKMIELKRVLDSVTLAAKGAELVINASIADKDVKTVLTQFDKVF